MKKAVGYLRVSTSGQAIDGISLQAQRERVEAWAAGLGFELLEVFEDAGISGKKTENRPGLREALDRACEEGAALVVYSLSRLARSTRDALEISERLSKAGADLVSLSENIDTTSAAGKMVFRMLAVLAEFERDLVSERTKMALAHIKAQGRHTGGDIPFGFQEDEAGLLIENPEERKAIRLMKKLKREGLSLRKIAARLEARGIRPRRGGSWSAEAIRRILKREAA